MKIKEVMSANPVCCVPGDSAQEAARTMCDHNIGSIPVVVDQESRKVVGGVLRTGTFVLGGRRWSRSKSDQD